MPFDPRNTDPGGMGGYWRTVNTPNSGNILVPMGSEDPNLTPGFNTSSALMGAGPTNNPGTDDWLTNVPILGPQTTAQLDRVRAAQMQAEAYQQGDPWSTGYGQSGNWTGDSSYSSTDVLGQQTNPATNREFDLRYNILNGANSMSPQGGFSWTPTYNGVRGPVPNDDPMSASVPPPPLTGGLNTTGAGPGNYPDASSRNAPVVYPPRLTGGLGTGAGPGIYPDASSRNAPVVYPPALTGGLGTGAGPGIYPDASSRNAPVVYPPALTGGLGTGAGQGIYPDASSRNAPVVYPPALTGGLGTGAGPGIYPDASSRNAPVVYPPATTGTPGNPSYGRSFGEGFGVLPDWQRYGYKDEASYLQALRNYQAQMAIFASGKGMQPNDDPMSASVFPKRQTRTGGSTSPGDGQQQGQAQPLPEGSISTPILDGAGNQVATKVTLPNGKNVWNIPNLSRNGNFPWTAPPNFDLPTWLRDKREGTPSPIRTRTAQGGVPQDLGQQIQQQVQQQIQQAIPAAPAMPQPTAIPNAQALRESILQNMPGR